MPIVKHSHNSLYHDASSLLESLSCFTIGLTVCIYDSQHYQLLPDQSDLPDTLSVKKYDSKAQTDALYCLGMDCSVVCCFFSCTEKLKAI